MKITRDMLEEFKTARGGYLSKVLRILHVNAYGNHGWQKKIEGKEISSAEVLQIVLLNEAHDKDQADRGILPRPAYKTSREPAIERVIDPAWESRTLEAGKLPWE
jgi:hypothetical protein